MLREGALVDATLIAAPPSTKNGKKERDPEMRQTKKGNQWYFGMKAHIGADRDGKLVHTVIVTAVNVADVTQTAGLLHGQEKQVHADAGDTGVGKRAEIVALERKIDWQIAGKRSVIKAMAEGAEMGSYFREHMVERDLLFHDTVAPHPAAYVPEASAAQQRNYITHLHQTLNASSHPIRNRLLRIFFASRLCLQSLRLGLAHPSFESWKRILGSDRYRAMKSPFVASRRRFLLQAALAGSAPFLLPSWSARSAPSNRINLAFIGLGVQGRGLLGGFLRRDSVQVVAVCDVDANRREDGRLRVDGHYQKQGDRPSFKGCMVFEDFREMLARPDIDAVVIATPDHWHALTTIAAAEAGKDVYCEKPLSKSVHESRAMVKAVRKNKRVLQVGSMQRSMREFRVACELVRNGLLGKIDRVEVTVGGPATLCDLPGEKMEPGLNWDLWLGPAALRPYNSILSPRGVHNNYPNWRHYREFGGGAVTDFGAHHFDIAQWGLGMDLSGPVEIVPPADWQTAQNGVRMRYASGVELIHAPGRNDVTFFGKDGMVQVDRGRISVAIGGKSIEKEDMPLRDQLERIEKAFLQNPKVPLYRSTDHAGDWLESIRTRKAPICDVETGGRTATVCHLVNLAYYHGQSMKWDPAHERFSGGTGDASWLDVSHRAPWKLA